MFTFVAVVTLSCIAGTLAGKLNNSRAKVAKLEKALAKQKQDNKDLSALIDSIKVANG